MTQQYVIGIDLGGTFIKGGAVFKGGEIAFRAGKKSGAKEGPLQPVANMLDVVEELSQKMGKRPSESQSRSENTRTATTTNLSE